MKRGGELKRKTPLRATSFNLPKLPPIPLRKTALPTRAKLKGGKSTGKPTKAQLRRFEAIVAIGCIACRLHGLGYTVPEVHHLNVCSQPGGKRRGHDFTIGLCSWHHRADPMSYPVAYMEQHCGPTWAKHKRKFIETFGDDDALLTYQNELIGEQV